MDTTCEAAAWILDPDDWLWITVVGFIVAFTLSFGIGADVVAKSFGTFVDAAVLKLRHICILGRIFVARVAFCDGARSLYILQEISRQLSLTPFICLLSLLVSNCKASVIPHPPKAILNMSEKTFSPCTRSPRVCPNTDRDRVNHIMCIYNYRGTMSCPQGYSYFCDPDASGYVVENCFPTNECPKGTTNFVEFDVHTQTAQLSCRPCKGNFTQPYPHDSATDFIPGCTVPQLNDLMIKNLDKMKKVVDGGTTGYDQYVCDTSRGYSNVLRHMMCNVSDPCDCDNEVTCTDEEFPVLLPDGTCDKPCMTDRDTNFKCHMYEQPHITETSMQPSVSSIHLSTKTTSDIAQQTDLAQGTTNAPVSDSNKLWIILVVLILLVVIGIIVIVVYCLKCGRNQENTERKTVDDHANEPKQAKKRWNKTITKIREKVNGDKNEYSGNIQKIEYNNHYYGRRETDHMLEPKMDNLELDGGLSGRADEQTMMNGHHTTPYRDMPLIPCRPANED